MKAGGIIAHAISVTGNEVMVSDIVVMTLVKGLGMEKVGRCTSSGSGAFVLPEEGRSVVCLREDGMLMDIKTLGSCFMMEEATGKFEITVGDSTMRIVPAGEFGSSSGVESRVPNNRMSHPRVRVFWSSSSNIV